MFINNEKLFKNFNIYKDIVLRKIIQNAVSKSNFLSQSLLLLKKILLSWDGNLMKKTII